MTIKLGRDALAASSRVSHSSRDRCSTRVIAWFSNRATSVRAPRAHLRAQTSFPLPSMIRGWDIEAVPKRARARAKLVYVTPSHQFPTGETLSLSRRQMLLSWAVEHDAYIFEDDYGGELRYEGRPLESLDDHRGPKVVSSIRPVLDKHRMPLLTLALDGISETGKPATPRGMRKTLT